MWLGVWSQFDVLFVCLQDVYETFNIVMRRKPKENNFKVT